MFESLPFLFSGLFFGLVAGLSPGPLFALVISETVRHSSKEGIIVAVAPVLTDIPIVALALMVSVKVSEYSSVLGVLSLSGGVFIAYMAFESISLKRIETDVPNARARSFKKGMITNILSPHPYLFWMTVGSPAVIKAVKVNMLSAVLFVAGFYLLLVGSKVAIAVIAGRFKSFLQGRAYIGIIRTLGVILLVYSIVYLKDGLKLLGVF